MFNGNPTTQVEQTITNDGFWPDLSVSEFQRLRKLPAELAGEVMAAALLNAATHTNSLLAQKTVHWQRLGITSANDIPGLQLSGSSWAVECYRHAVHARAKALLLPEFASVVQRSEANNAYEQEREPRATLMAEADSHINRLLDCSDVRVTLI